MSGGNWKEMFYAVQKNDLELVRYHLKTGVDPNFQHEEVLTSPLIESLQHGHYEIAKLLLENGADPSLKEVFGHHTPLSMAKASKNKKLVELVQRYLRK